MNLPSSISISYNGNKNTSIMLNKVQSEQLRSLIERNIPCKFASYVRQMGLDPQNVYAMFSGRRKLTLKVLEKLLAGTDLEIECQIEFLVQTNGHHAQVVSCRSLEEQLFLETGEELGIDQ